MVSTRSASSYRRPVSGSFETQTRPARQTSRSPTARAALPPSSVIGTGCNDLRGEMSTHDSNQEQQKRLAAQKSLEYIEDGMLFGLGTGSTIAHLIPMLGERVAAGL